MGIVKTPTLMLYVSSGSAGSPQLSAGYEVSEDMDFALGLKVTAATVSLMYGYFIYSIGRVEVYADPAGASTGFGVGTNSKPFFKRDVITASGTRTVSTVFPIPHCPKYIKARFVPYNTSSGLTNLYFYAIEQKKT